MNCFTFPNSSARGTARAKSVQCYFWNATRPPAMSVLHGDAWPAGDLAVQEAVKIGLGLKTRPTAKQMAPLAEPWRPFRGAAAHLWWSYYRTLKKREGVVVG
jgi:hypothetical protein